jgi:hypothetical protein
VLFETAANRDLRSHHMKMAAFLGAFGAVLGNVALRSIVIIALVAAAGFAVQAITAGMSFILESLGRL